MLSNLATRWQFRSQRDDEAEAAYRRALAEHVRAQGYLAEAGEILLAKPQAAWTPADKGAVFDHLVVPYGGAQ